MINPGFCFKKTPGFVSSFHPKALKLWIFVIPLQLLNCQVTSIPNGCPMVQAPHGNAQNKDAWKITTQENMTHVDFVFCPYLLIFHGNKSAQKEEFGTEMKMIEKNQHAIILLPDSMAKSKYPPKDLTRALPNGHLFCEYGPWSYECRRDMKLSQQKTGFLAIECRSARDRLAHR